MRLVRFTERATYNDSIVEPGTEMWVDEDTPLAEHMAEVTSEEAAIARANEAEVEARELRAAFEALPSKEKVEAAEKLAADARSEADKAIAAADKERERVAAEKRDARHQREDAERAPQFIDHTADRVEPKGVLQKKGSSSVPDAPTPKTPWSDKGDKDPPKASLTGQPESVHPHPDKK